MIAVAIATVVGMAVAAGLWLITEKMFAVQSLQRTNYRGASVGTAAGVLIPLTTLFVVAAGYLVVLLDGGNPVWFRLARTAVLAGAAFGLLGLLDDVAGVGQSGGFKRHMRALFRGEMTSGSAKMLGGAAAGILVAASAQSVDSGVLAALRDGAVVALAANLANLFDRAPGRCTKFSALAFAVAAAIARKPELAGPAVGIGAAVGLLVPDLREKLMLGDSGANPLGALVGLGWLVALPAPGARWTMLAVLLAANLASEAVSFSAVIGRIAPLAWFDRLGSLRTR